jgi:hypothetical protein
MARIELLDLNGVPMVDMAIIAAAYPKHGSSRAEELALKLSDQAATVPGQCCFAVTCSTL